MVLLRTRPPRVKVNTVLVYQRIPTHGLHVHLVPLQTILNCTIFARKILRELRAEMVRTARDYALMNAVRETHHANTLRIGASLGVTRTI